MWSGLQDLASFAAMQWDWWRPLANAIESQRRRPEDHYERSYAASAHCQPLTATSPPGSQQQVINKQEVRFISCHLHITNDLILQYVTSTNNS